MQEKDFMSKIRTLDHRIARWLMRHFYFTFFQLVLFVIFVFWIFNTFTVIDTNFQADKDTLYERILLTQSINLTIASVLLILNSFWLLYIFNGIQRLGNLLKDISYNISRLRYRNN